MTEPGPRYVAEKFHATKMQKRLYPEAAGKPWTVRDTVSGRLVGLPDRYRNQSGAQARADRLNERGDPDHDG